MTATLSISTLGTGHGYVQRHGARLLTSDGQVHDLFYYLLCAPEGRTRQQIIQDVWGADEDAAALNRLRVTLHRLKSLFKGLTVIQEHDGRYHLHPDIVSKSDLGTFLTSVHRARITAQPALKKAALQHAAAQYRGDFLPDMHHSWTDHTREHFRQQYVQVLLELTALHCDSAECTPAITQLKEALRVDPFLDEQLHRDLMCCMAATGDSYGAVAHYRQFKRFLQHDLGDSPMRETEELAEGIKQRGHICPRHMGSNLPCPKLALQSTSIQSASAVSSALPLLLQLSEHLLAATSLKDAVAITGERCLAFLHASSCQVSHLNQMEVTVVYNARAPQNSGAELIGEHWSQVESEKDTGEEVVGAEAIPLSDGSVLLLEVRRSATYGAWNEAEREFFTRAAHLLSRCRLLPHSA
ncbi:AfsR/SARP family transcriptional regulator [Deinococcus hopiensis]|uniref:DNA-binding transcriptional activator of the SARP family n=1 Tax=Deinococcus hopiensis KR-140 TaxID=695939 RepID=A0A1W1VUW4_9DEIO|nr:BTAD domain-containing putative transcriptional regulator [Deinococcus hopiensis]SMB97148.1 DNA-binding transcriptional activator of the SARP family [Deinococcus hopiensis KR-140]